MFNKVMKWANVILGILLTVIFVITLNAPVLFAAVMCFGSVYALHAETVKDIRKQMIAYSWIIFATIGYFVFSASALGFVLLLCVFFAGIGFMYFNSQEIDDLHQEAP